MEVTLFTTFSKKYKSTKIPLPTDASVTLQIGLKDECSILNPRFMISSDPSQYKYVYVHAWGRYYHIRDSDYDNGKWFINCEVDKLGSFRTQIINTVCNILYATDSTKNIIDSRIPLLSNVDIQDSPHAIDGLTVQATSLGAVILSITGRGSFGTYLMQDSTLISELLDGVDDWWTTSTTDTIEAAKQLYYGGSAGECLKNAIGIPLVFGGSDVGAGNAEDLWLGGYPCKDSNNNPIKGYKITRPLITSTTVCSIPWVYHDWRQNAPYTNVVVYLPFIGLVELPTNKLLGQNSIKVRYSINVTSGDISVSIDTASNVHLVTCNGNIAMAVPFGSSGVDTSKLTQGVSLGIGSVVGALGSVAMTGGLSIPAALGLAGGLSASAGVTLSALGGATNGSGGLGGGASQGIDSVIHVYTISRTLTDSQDSFKNIMGKPFMSVDALSNHSGFVMTEGFQIDGDMTLEEKEDINRLLDSGIYLE